MAEMTRNVIKRAAEFHTFSYVTLSDITPQKRGLSPSKKKKNPKKKPQKGVQASKQIMAELHRGWHFKLNSMISYAIYMTTTCTYIIRKKVFWAYRTEEIKSYESNLSLFLFTKPFNEVNDCNKLSYYAANFVFDKVTVCKNGPIHFSIKLYHAIKGP